MDDKLSFSLNEFEKLSQKMQKIFNDLISQGSPLLKYTDKGWIPSVDVYETENHMIVIVEAAGVAREDMNVTLQQNILTVQGIRRNRITDKKEKLHQMEIDFGEFNRVIPLTVQVMEEEITAKFKDGLLVIYLPKMQKTLSREIKINEK